MDCTHPVIYTRADGTLYCHVCGATINANEGQDKHPTEAEKPAEATKKPVKRKAKTN